MIIETSIIEPFAWRNRTFFVKRDDQIDPLLSGNKYRKLYSLLHTPAAHYQSITSYGGTQSNAMLSIAALCQQKGWCFHYTSRPVPAHLKINPIGNLKMALQLGMQLHEVNHEDYDLAIHALKLAQDATNLHIPQGGADPIAQAGMQQLAEEIKLWQQQCSIQSLYVVTPSGTGTTAYYLAQSLPDEVTLLTTAVVGDNTYLLAQMQLLGTLPDNLWVLENNKKYHFAQPYPELLSIWQELQDAGITFDLIYAAPMWDTLLQHIKHIKGTILYVHSGGLLGNATMLKRYRYKKMR